MELITVSYLLLLCGYSSAELVTVKDCGKTLAAVGRIIGGGVTKPGAHPWMVSLHENTGSAFQHVCGGAVLNENWIITAAHCIDFIDEPWKYFVLIGLHRLSRQNAPTVQKINISKIVLHEKYDDLSVNNDIALLKTAKPIDIAGSRGYVNGICLPATDEDPTGYATVTGWGHTYESGENSDILKKVVVPIIPREACNGAYDDDPLDESDEITETMICAGMARKDSCDNDSGGPLTQTNRKGISTLIGVVSYGFGCAYASHPGVYTKVSSFKDWIQNIVTE